MQAHAVSGVVGRQQVGERGGRGDDAAVDRGDHVAGRQPHAGRRVAGEHAGHGRPGVRHAQAGGARLRRRHDFDPEKPGGADVHRGRGRALRDLPRDRERRGDRDRVTADRRRPREGARGRGVHADHLPGGVDQRPARVAGADGGVGLDQTAEPLSVAAAGVACGDRLVERGDHAAGDQDDHRERRRWRQHPAAPRPDRDQRRHPPRRLGGPLVNAFGQVVGMNAAASTAFSRRASVQGYAIPIAAALSIARQIAQGTTSATVHIGRDRLSRGRSRGARTGERRRPGRVARRRDRGRSARRLSGGPRRTGGRRRDHRGRRPRRHLRDRAHRPAVGPSPRRHLRVHWLDPAGHGRDVTVTLANGPAA